VDHTGVGRLDLWHWTVGAKEMDHIVNLSAAIREAIGCQVDLAIDCHGQFDVPPGAITLARTMEDRRLLWLEEPVQAESIDALAQAQASTSTAICTGEDQCSCWEFLELLQMHACDVIMPDLGRVGASWSPSVSPKLPTPTTSVSDRTTSRRR
jgi:galactonate dehydratase